MSQEMGGRDARQSNPPRSRGSPLRDTEGAVRSLEVRSEGDEGGGGVDAHAGAISVDNEDEMLRGLDTVYSATAGERDKRSATVKLLARQRSLVDALIRAMCKYGKQVCVFVCVCARARVSLWIRLPSESEACGGSWKGATPIRHLSCDQTFSDD